MATCQPSVHCLHARTSVLWSVALFTPVMHLAKMKVRQVMVKRVHDPLQAPMLLVLLLACVGPHMLHSRAVLADHSCCGTKRRASCICRCRKRLKPPAAGGTVESSIALAMHPRLTRWRWPRLPPASRCSRLDCWQVVHVPAVDVPNGQAVCECREVDGSLRHAGRQEGETLCRQGGLQDGATEHCTSK